MEAACLMRFSAIHVISHAPHLAENNSMRFRTGKRGWSKADIQRLKDLIDHRTNEELCKEFNVDLATLRNVLNKYNIKRDENVLEQIRKDNSAGENNPNWKGGVSQDSARYSRLQRERHPEQKHARDAVYRALKTGRLVKPDACEDCGTLAESLPDGLHGHHESYDKDKWLDVVWLCRRCHRKRHGDTH